MPAEVVDACEKRELVIFAGAGISTESRPVLKETFYEGIAGELEIETTKPFPQLMSDYVARMTRRQLLQRIKERLDYIEAFPGMLRAATRFHAELATLYHVTDIVTTNWDPYFEQVTGALPLVTDRDFALAGMPGRKVFKIHGSIYNLGSIVATEDDYKTCYRSLNTSVLGGTLKNLLATKTVLFVGYSFGDSDFNRIYRFIVNQMTDVLPSSYVITLDDPASSTAAGAHTIKTDAAYFLHCLKTELLPRGSLLDDERWLALPRKLIELRGARSDLYKKVSNAGKSPAVVLCRYYQDGAIHALERMLARRHTGEYSCIEGVEQLVVRYEQGTAHLAKEKRYHDAAYSTGYRNGLSYLIGGAQDRKAMPTYFVYGSDDAIRSISAFKRVAKDAQKLHRPAYEQAERILRHVEGDVTEHRAEL